MIGGDFAVMNIQREIMFGVDECAFGGSFLGIDFNVELQKAHHFRKRQIELIIHLDSFDELVVRGIFLKAGLEDERVFIEAYYRKLLNLYVMLAFTVSVVGRTETGPA